MRSLVFSRRLLILAAIGIYLTASLVYLRLPGLQYDEVLFANAAMGNLDGSFVQWEIRIGGKSVPLMLMPYIGALKAYLYAPIFLFFGTNPASVRLPVVVVGLVTLWFTFKLCRAMLGEAIATLSLLLLATDPAFIFANRLDWGPVSLMMALKMASLYLIWRWLEVGRAYVLGIACFLLGLGLLDKVIFLWFLGALLIALPVCFRAELRSRLNRRAVVMGLICFALGCWPLIAYNIAFPLATFRGQKVVTRSWEDDLAYRHSVFRLVLEGNAVFSVVNSQRSWSELETSKHQASDNLGRVLTRLHRLFALEKTFNWYAFVIALSAIALLWFLKRLEMPQRVQFFLLLVALISLFMCATAEASGPHHVIMVHPFTHILVAVALCNLARILVNNAGERVSRLGRLLPAAGTIVLVIPQITMNAGYLRSFSVWGGMGNWSDAIYKLAGHALANRDKSFMLMDWGFSNQLLVLSGGRVKQEEAFVPVIDLPSVEEKRTVLLASLNRPASLFVFHSPRFETFPLLDLFRDVVAQNSLDLRLTKAFSQRDGEPIYLMYEVHPPEREAHLYNGYVFYLREMEEGDEVSGGGIDSKGGASKSKALGESWGRNTSDSAVYRFSLPGKASDTYFYLRYAFEPPGPRHYYLFLDDNFVDILTLQDTGGFGNTVNEWKTYTARIHTVDAGLHELRLKPAGQDQIVNLDYFYLSEGELRIDPGTSVKQIEAAWRSQGHSEKILGYQHRPEVRLEVTPPEVIAGISSLTVRVVNQFAPAIDVIYSIDGKIMPPLYGWQLDANHEVTMRVGNQTRKGLYRYLAIRDSRASSPTSWIPTDVKVRVK
jgi:4-amino-4-deoxy-L-arabinose transferase-like glycosyltransferase